jgi:1-acyl-sn-glycerol-3-phosphate acyltransferase
MNEVNATQKVVQRILKTLAFYHRHSVKGLEYFPLEGPVILAVNHSLATYDGFLVGLQLFNHLGRLPKGLGDELLFRIPIVEQWCRDLGLYSASPTAAKELLQRGEVLGVAPGGMRESLRPSEERFSVLWEKRKGFVRLAQETGAPIVLAACPAADLLYDVYPSVITKFVYKHFKVPLPIMRGLGPTWIPRPHKLTHYLSRPLYIGPEENIDQAHHEICLLMEEMLTNQRPGLVRQGKA